MSTDTPPPVGILDSIRRLCNTGLSLLQNRVELFGVELEEQKARLIRVMLFASAAIFLANTAVLVITATIVVLVGDHARVPVLVGLCVLYLTAALAAFLALRKELRSSPPPFNGVASELKKDIQWLNPPK